VHCTIRVHLRPSASIFVEPFLRCARQFLCLALLLAATAAPRSAAAQAARFPGATWDQLPPAQSGWSAPVLDRAQADAQRLGSTAVVVVQHGVIVASWGETDADILLNSARKSLLSALIGIAVAHGDIRLGYTRPAWHR